MFRKTTSCVLGKPLIKFFPLPVKELSFRHFASVSSQFSVTNIDGISQYPKFDKQRTEFKEFVKKSRKPDKSLDLSSTAVNPNSFGDLAESHQHRRLASEYLPDDDDKYDTFNTFSDKKVPVYYKIEFRRLIQSGGARNLKQALELYRKMKAEDGYCPDKAHFTHLIKGCAQAGYTKKAFELLEELLNSREHNYTVPTQATITSLFRSCAVCPYPKFGLEKARYLRNYLQEINFVPSQIQYHAMISAFSKCGDLQTAFDIVNEMANNKVKIEARTISMILAGCGSTKESGLNYAISIVRRMRYYRLTPNIFTYNMLLDIVRSSKMGSIEEIQKLIHEWDKWSPEKTPKNILNRIRKGKRIDLTDAQWTPLAEDHDQHFVSANQSSQTDSLIKIQFTNDLSTADNNKAENTLAPVLPNLLAPTSDSVRGQVIGLNIKSLDQPHHRLSLLGGADGILDLMAADNVKPDIKTFHRLAHIVPKNAAAECALVERMESLGIEPDLTFFNIIIKRVAQRSDVSKLKPILNQMTLYGLSPDLMTFGAMAIGCKSFLQSKQFIEDLASCGVEPNMIICNQLATNGTYASDFWQIIYAMNLMDKFKYKVSQSTLEAIESLLARVHVAYASHDHGRTEQLPPELASSKSRAAFNKFKTRYAEWKKSVEIEMAAEPWKQFEVANSYGREKYDKFEKEMKTKIEQRFGVSLNPPEHFSAADPLDDDAHLQQ